MMAVRTLESRWPILLLIVPLLLCSSCTEQVNWLKYRGENGAGYTSNSLYPPLGTRWKLALQEREEDATSFNPPIVKGDTIFFGSTDKNFYAFNLNTGYKRWIFETKNIVNSVPFADDETVYFGSNDGNVYAVDIESGKERWSFYSGNTIQSLVIRYKDHIIFTSDTGATFFLDVSEADRFRNTAGWKPPVENRIPNRIWSHHTFQVYDDIVYWAPLDYGFGAYDINERRFVWDVRVTVDYPVWYSFPALDDERVYYASNFLTRSGAILRYYAADRRDGRNIWEYERSFQAGTNMDRTMFNYFRRHVDLLDYMAPALWRDLVIFTSGDTQVVAFDNESGAVIWTANFDYPTSSAPTVAGDRVYFGVHGGEVGSGGDTTAPRLVCVSARNGRVLWQMEVDGAVLSAPVISGKQMLFGTTQNQFYVLEEIF